MKGQANSCGPNTTLRIWRLPGLGKVRDQRHGRQIGGLLQAQLDQDVDLKNLFGARMKIISGYPGGAEIAIETGEVDDRCGWSWSPSARRRRR
jgi:hypothetical protein